MAPRCKSPPSFQNDRVPTKQVSISRTSAYFHFNDHNFALILISFETIPRTIRSTLRNQVKHKTLDGPHTIETWIKNSGIPLRDEGTFGWFLRASDVLEFLRASSKYRDIRFPFPMFDRARFDLRRNKFRQYPRWFYQRNSWRTLLLASCRFVLFVDLRFIAGGSIVFLRFYGIRRWHFLLLFIRQLLYSFGVRCSFVGDRIDSRREFLERNRLALCYRIFAWIVFRGTMTYVELFDRLPGNWFLSIGIRRFSVNGSRGFVLVNDFPVLLMTRRQTPIQPQLWRFPRRWPTCGWTCNTEACIDNSIKVRFLFCVEY